MKNFSRTAFLTSLHDRTFRVFGNMLVSGLILASVMASAADAGGSVAAKYHNDLGIGDDPNVIFFDDFKSWKADGTRPPSGKWSVRKNKVSRTHVVPGKIKDGVRFRRVPNLRITFFSLETYYHGLPQEYGPDNPIEVYFDNVVIAKEYVGPINMLNPKK